MPASYSQTGLPPGLTFNTTTGAITGTPSAPGSYIVQITATNSAGSTTTSLTIVVAPVLTSWIGNFSARALSGSGSDTLILGFVVSGGAKNLLVRGVGPALANFGISSPLSDPTLTLDGPSGLVATNDAWQTSTGGQSQAALITATDTQVGAFALPAGSADAALVATVNAGSYTASILS